MPYVTHHEPFLTLVRESLPCGVRGIYQLGYLFQLGPRTAGTFLNIREIHASSNDVEIGNDLAVFSDPELRKVDSIQSVTRTKIVKLDSGYAKELTYPLYGSFIPLGSGLPHEGTGFALSLRICRSCDEKGRVLHGAHTATIPSSFELIQFSYDGKTVAKISEKRIAPEKLIPGWIACNGGFSLPIPGKEGFLGPFVARKEKGEARSGVLSWKYGSGGWAADEFIPVTNICNFEPSMIETADGSLLLTSRVSAYANAEGRPDIKAEQKHCSSIRIWKSSDRGKHWKMVLCREGVLASPPRRICQDAEGKIYIAGSPLPPGVPPGDYTDNMRWALDLWPVKADLSEIEPPLPLSVPNTAPGYHASPDNCFFTDHPNSQVCVLADGKKHTLFSFRVLSRFELMGLSDECAWTGNYLEELKKDASL